MTARDRLRALLTDPPAPGSDTGPWIDVVGSRPGARGRLQDVWESGPGALGYAGALAVGERVESVVPALLGGDGIRDFYRVERRLRVLEGETVLDLACGPGTLTRRLADAVGPAGLVIATDLSVPMLSRAARAVRHGAVAFLRADAMDVPLRDDSVDAVCCSLCLHLVPDLDGALAGVARVLRPGGRVALAVPAYGRGPFRALTETLERYAQARLFSPGELPAALSRQGFERVRERRAGGTLLVDATASGAPGTRRR